MRIGVVADTHLPRFGRALPEALVRGLTDPPIDLVLHLGDMTDLLAVDLLEEIAPVRAVAGNNDAPRVRARYPERDVLEAEGVRLGLVHGHAGRGRTTEERALAAFAGEPLDAVLYGHSHLPACRRLGDGRWLINPGSPTDRRRQPHYSYALLEIRAGAVSAELRFYADRAHVAAGSGEAPSA
jgi:putative phosphoesterase